MRSRTVPSILAILDQCRWWAGIALFWWDFGISFDLSGIVSLIPQDELGLKITAALRSIIRSSNIVSTFAMRPAAH